MDLRLYGGILWRRKHIVALTTLIAVAIIALGVSRLQDSFVATATLRLATVVGGGDTYVEFDVPYSDRLLNTFAFLATSRPVMEAVYLEFELESFPAVETEVVLNTELLKISVTDEDPEQASTIANFVAQEVIERVQSSDVIFNNSALTRGALRISVVESATPPNSPSGPNRSLFIVTGLLAGLLGGTALAFLFENLDTRIFKTDEIERMARVPIIGRIPLARNLGRVMFMFVIYPYVEAFRQLRTNTLAAMKSQSFRTLLVVSAEPEEGKSTIALNLACSIALTGKRVALIDADMRRPTLHTMLKIDQPIGLSDVLRGSVSLEDALVTTTFGQLDFLPAGANSPNPAELLETNILARTMETAEKDYDVVIIDTPPLLAVADALILAEYADAVMLVVKRGSTTANAIQDALKQLGKMRAKPIGVVMNNAERENYPTYQKSIRSKKRGLQGLFTRKRTESRNGYRMGDEDETIGARPVEFGVVERD